MTAEPATPASTGGASVGGIDLHLHSTASDGTTSPEEVVGAAIRARLAAIALTDHDTVAGVESARAAAASGEVEVVAGVELSAYDGADELHILGLHLTDTAKMDAELAVFRDARRTRASEMVARLNAVGVKITFDEVLSLAGDATLGRPHVAKALVENGYARDFRDAFDRYLGLGRPGYLEKRRLSVADAIALVHACGGIAVLAHPADSIGLERLTALVRAGLDGLEVLHPSHAMDTRARLQELVTRFDLVPSGGSDSHGAPEGPRSVGAMGVPAAWLDAQRLRVNERRRLLSSTASADGA